MRINLQFRVQNEFQMGQRTASQVFVELHPFISVEKALKMLFFPLWISWSLKQLLYVKGKYGQKLKTSIKQWFRAQIMFFYGRLQQGERLMTINFRAPYFLEKFCQIIRKVNINNMFIWLQLFKLSQTINLQMKSGHSAGFCVFKITIVFFVWGQNQPLTTEL